MLHGSVKNISMKTFKFDPKKPFKGIFINSICEPQVIRCHLMSNLKCKPILQIKITSKSFSLLKY